MGDASLKVSEGATAVSEQLLEWGGGVKTYVMGWVEPKVEVKAGEPERN